MIVEQALRYVRRVAFRWHAVFHHDLFCASHKLPFSVLGWHRHNHVNGEVHHTGNIAWEIVHRAPHGLHLLSAGDVEAADDGAIVVSKAVAEDGLRNHQDVGRYVEQDCYS